MIRSGVRWIVVSSLSLALTGCSEFVGSETSTDGDSSSGGTSNSSTPTPTTDPSGDPTTDGEGSSSASQGSTSTDSTTSGDPTTDTTTNSTDGETTTETTDGETTSSETGDDTTGGSNANCGDGVEDPGEACDDGDDDELDGCTSSCVLGPTGLEYGATFETALDGGGSMTGIQNATDNCPPGGVLVALRGGLSDEGWIGVIGGVCRPSSASNEDPPAFQTSDPVTQLPQRGQFGAADTWFTECADDQAIVAVRGNAGDVMDGLEIRCADIATVGDPGNYALDPSPTAWLPLQGGSGGSDFGPLACPDGTVATGLQTDTNSYVIRVRLLCRELGFAYP